MPLVLNRHHREIVLNAAARVPAEKRDLFVERVRARLQIYGFRFTDDELDTAIGLALTGLIQQPAA